MRKVLLPNLLLLGSAVALVAATIPSSAMHVRASETNTYMSKDFSADGTADGLTISGMSLTEVESWKGYKLDDPGAGGSIRFQIATLDPSSAFEAVSLEISNSRLAYYFGDFGFALKVNVSEDGTTFANAYTETFASGANKSAVSADITSALAGLSTAYIELALTPTTPGCGFDSSWVIVEKFEVLGTEAVSDTHSHSYTVADYWGGRGTAGTSIPNSSIWNATSVTGLGGDGNPDWGCVATTWGGNVSVSEGQSAQIVYRIGQGDQLLTGATVKGEFRFWNANNGDIHAGDRIWVDLSLDGENYTRIKHYGHVDVESTDANAGVTDQFNSASDPLKFNISIDDWVATNGNPQYAYVKFTMKHYLAVSADLGNWGMFVHDTGVSYSTKDASIITYNLDGGTLPADAKTGFFYDETEVYTLPTPTKEGYTFLGWKRGEEVVTTFDPAGGSATLTATWELPNTSHAIHYVDPLGAPNANPDHFGELDAEIITLSDLEMPGYTFLGWYDAETEGNKVETIVPSSHTEDITLYARWSENEYALSYRVDANVDLAAEGLESLPETVKTSATIRYTVTPKTGYGLSYVKVNGKIVTLEGNAFSVKGSSLTAQEIEVAAYEKYTTQSDEVSLDFTTLEIGDHSWKGSVYDAANLRLVKDSVANSGLSLDADGTSAHIILKFSAEEGKLISGLTLGGMARLFDFNNGAYVETNLQASVSSDNENYTLIKQFAATNLTNGDEFVSLAFAKEFDDAMEGDLFLKITLNGTSGTDWAVLKQLSVAIERTAKPVEVSSEEVSSEVPSSTEDPVVTSEEPIVSSEEPTPEPEPEKKGCGGSIIAASSLFAAVAFLGVGLLVSKKRKE